MKVFLDLCENSISLAGGESDMVVVVEVTVM
jgi:hypothetical protein